MCSLSTSTNNVRARQAPKRHIITFAISDDQPAIFSLADTETANVSNAYVQLNWRNPKQPLALVIVTPYTQNQEAFVVHLDLPEQGTMSKIYQIFDGNIVELSMKKTFFKLHSDSNYQVVLNFTPVPDKSDEVEFGYLVEKL